MGQHRDWLSTTMLIPARFTIDKCVWIWTARPCRWPATRCEKLPIRLGTLNANGKQELYVYALTRTGRVETTNYRTVKIPSNTEVPEFVQDEFAEFYRAMFAQQVQKENERAVFLEYAWDMGWCDPCAADPLSSQELRQLGVFWLDDRDGPKPRRIAPQPVQNVFVT